MTAARLRAAAEILALLTVLVLAALRERQAHGVEALLIASGLALLGPLARRALVCLGRAEPAPFALTVLELFAFASFASDPPAGWGLGLLGLSALWHAAPRWDSSPEVSRSRSAYALEEGLVALLTLLALALFVAKPPARALLTVFLVDAYGPGAPRDFGAARRRLAGFALGAAFLFVVGHEGGDRDHPHGEDLLLVAVIVLVGLQLRRLFARADSERETGATLRRGTRLAFRVALAVTAGMAIVLAGAPSITSPKALDRLLVADACLLFAAWRSGAVRLGARSTKRVRAATLLVVLIVVGAGLVRGRNRLFLGVDTASYLSHESTRTALYPAFVDALDPERDLPRSQVEVFEDPREEPGHRFVGVPRAQKILLLAGIGALFWALTAVLDARLTLLLVGTGLVCDLERWGDATVTRNVDSVLTEGLNHSLVFAFMAAVAAYFFRPNRWRSLAVGLLLAAMNLNRPANVAFLAVIPWIALFHARRDGLRAAALRSAGVTLIVVTPLLLECSRQHAAHGHFRLHTFTGMNLLDTALQVATPEDVPEQSDPIARDFLKICVVDMADRRLGRDHSPLGRYVDQNLYRIAYPALERLQREGKAPTGPESLFFADDLFGRVAKNLIARHPRSFLELVAFHLRCYFTPSTHLVALAVCSASLFAYARSGSPVMLFVSFFAAMPALSMVPACLFNFPLPRYRSQMLWAEDLTGSLFLVSVASVGRAAWSRRSSLDPPLGHA